MNDPSNSFYSPSRKEWRQWLEKNHDTEKMVSLVIYHKASETPSIYYEEAVLEALCFGWIDSKQFKRDDDSTYLTFSPRNPKSNWSKPNRERIAQLEKEGLIKPAGRKMIDIAKETGTWTALEDVENGVIPEDLAALFDKNKMAHNNFMAFSPSARKMMLEWVMTAKLSETRQKRVTEIVDKAAQNKKAYPKE